MGVERAALQYHVPELSAVFWSQLGLVMGGAGVMLSLSVKQQKQGPAEIVCCLSTFLA